MKNQSTIAVALIGVALTGCARMITQPLSGSHPGNPAAPEASYPSATPYLLVGTNLAMTSQTDHQPSPNADAPRQSDKSKQHDEHNHNTPKK